MTTSIFEGLQPALSLYRTENVMVVDGVPEPGDALPSEHGSRVRSAVAARRHGVLARRPAGGRRDREGNRKDTRPALFGSVSGCDGSCAVWVS